MNIIAHNFFNFRQKEMRLNGWMTLNTIYKIPYFYYSVLKGSIFTSQLSIIYSN